MRTINCIKFDASYVNERGQEEIIITNVPDWAKVQVGDQVVILRDLIDSIKEPK